MCSHFLPTFSLALCQFDNYFWPLPFTQIIRIGIEDASLKAGLYSSFRWVQSFFIQRVYFRVPIQCLVLRALKDKQALIYILVIGIMKHTSS